MKNSSTTLTMNKFEIRTLGELLELNESGTWGDEGDASDYPVLRSSNIHNGKLVLNDVEFRKVSSRDAQRYKLDDGDIIVTKSSGSPHLIGKSCLFRNPDGRTYLFSNFTQRLRAKMEFIYPSFLHFFLQSPIAKDFLQKISNTNSGLRNLNMKDYGRQLIPVLPLPIQKQIAAILEKADAAREKRRQANKLTEQFLQSVFLEMFGDPATNPKGWNIEKLGDIATIIMGQSPQGDNYNYEGIGVPLLNGPTEFGLRHPKEKQWTTQSTKLCKSGDVLFCVRGATAGRMNWADKEYCIGRGLAAIRNQKSNEFVYSFLRLKYQHFQSIGQGSTFINISKNVLSDLKLPFPPVELQRKFTTLVEKVESLPASDGSMRQAGLQAKQRESEKELENLFNSLIQRAFRGELV